jgi:hypothetical protein
MGKPIAAQHSLEMLGAAGLIKFGTPAATKPGLVVNGNILTSFNCPHMAQMDGKPADTGALIAQFIKMIALEQ